MLTDEDWLKVFELRCKSKRGERLSGAEQRLVERAFRADETRYAALEPDVFDATVPFGSNVRWRR